MSGNACYEKVPCAKCKRMISKNVMARHLRANCGEARTRAGRRRAYHKKPLKERLAICAKKREERRIRMSTEEGRERYRVSRRIHELRTSIGRFMERVEKKERELMELVAKQQEWKEADRVR
jgi:hypothetical protein